MITVLVVEDERDARELLIEGLVRLGYNAIGAANGEEAVGFLNETIDVVVTDLVMPRMDGINLLGAMRQKQLSAISIVITSFADKERSIQALNLGASFLIEKPFTVALLRETIQRLLGERAQTPDLSRLVTGRIAGLGIGERDTMLVMYVLKGLPNREIALSMEVSEQSVKNYLFLLYRKLGISSRGELFHLVFPV